MIRVLRYVCTQTVYKLHIFRILARLRESKNTWITINLLENRFTTYSVHRNCL